MTRQPVGYSAEGTHAMYGTPGHHEYVLPLGLLHDTTDRGPLWDPLLNALMYTYNVGSQELRPSDVNPEAPTEWFHYRGHWGDKFYPLDDPRQYRFAGQYHYGSGPLGPKFKNLGRSTVCQTRRGCIVKNWMGENTRREWPGYDDDEELNEETDDR